ncbi:unnamed protein product [Caenorhabditis bovis]|uniref:Uncharacterized protein n=1 Tax=Caenorhabditis bovis TaxID=2654633 RepID=A0A8S1F1Z3_9PELO|nr:unnamed protein product [Caenorhabditis bovis]
MCETRNVSRHISLHTVFVENSHEKKKKEKESAAHSYTPQFSGSHIELKSIISKQEHSYIQDENRDHRIRGQYSEECTALRLDPTTPKDLNIQTQDVDEDEVNKLVAKLKEKPKNDAAPVQLDSRTQLVLDRVTKKKHSLRLLSDKPNENDPRKISSTKSMRIMLTEPTQPPTNDQNSTMTAIALNEQADNNANLKTAMYAVETRNSPSVSMIEDDHYDTVPKLEEVLKLPNDDIFGTSGYPTWMDYLEPKEEDIVGVEAPCPVGSEHIEMFHEKKFKMKSAPDGKIQLDQWLPLAKLQTRDEVYFTSDIVFCNTLRSLINVSSAKKMKISNSSSQENIENVMKTQCDDEALSVTITDPNPHKYYSYSRLNPIESAQNRVFVDKTIPPKKELNSCYDEI